MIPRPIILVVDDEPDNLDLIERVLGFDYEIHRAPNGEEALRVLRQVPDVAVIITDQKGKEVRLAPPGKEGGK